MATILYGKLPYLWEILFLRRLLNYVTPGDTGG